MGFSTDPFRVCTIYRCNSEGELKETDNTDFYRWACEACGGHATIVFDGDSPVKLIHADFLLHVRFSHRIEKKNTKDWALGV